MSRSSSWLTDRWKASRGRRHLDAASTPHRRSCDRTADDWRMTSVPTSTPHQLRGKLPHLYGYRRWRIFTPPPRLVGTTRNGRVEYSLSRPTSKNRQLRVMLNIQIIAYYYYYYCRRRRFYNNIIIIVIVIICSSR